MLIFMLMLVIFVLGYTAIALEHPIKVDKSASALLIGALLWAVYALNAQEILALNLSPSWLEMKEMAHQIMEWISPQMTSNDFANSAWKETTVLAHHEVAFVKHELEHHLVEIAEILFFLFGAMTIVEIIDQHQGFKVITDKIRTTNQVKLLWILSILTFFMSAALDNLTTTIVMVALLRKLISDKKMRWFFASMVVLAANAGGAWSPIGDVTTIMLWIGGQVTAGKIIAHVFLPSLATMVVPLIILSFTMKGKVTRPEVDSNAKEYTTNKERVGILILGVSALLFVPVFKTVTHLPPYVGMLFGLGTMWFTTEVMHRKKAPESKRKLVVLNILQKVDTPTLFFFLGILSAVAALQSAGHLAILSGFLDDKLGNIYLINLAIGVLSSIVDNVPLVAGAMGMYPIHTADSIQLLTDPAALEYAKFFFQDGAFWEFLAYCAGTGGSILIIGSAAGVAAMGMEKIDFIWYFKKISLLALIGYIAGAVVFYFQAKLYI